MKINSFSLGGYRSFGQEAQIFEKLRKINLFIGQNNSGKSNVLRFLHEIYPSITNPGAVRLKPLDKHMPSGTPFVVGQPISITTDREGNYTEFNKAILPLFEKQYQKTGFPGQVLRLFQAKASLDSTNDVWFEYDNNLNVIHDGWEDAFNIFSDSQLITLWNKLTGRNHGTRALNWIPDILKTLTPKFVSINVALIPAIRQVGVKGSQSDDFSGNGIIERLVKLQNPSVHNQIDRVKFDSINRFLQTVTDNPSATIEVPHERETILVHMDGKTLPLESLGTGIHEVIILASAATILEDHVICMEEPELHLNPILQKKLVRYLASSTNNQYFISTHSASLMDTQEAEIYHITLVNGESEVERVTSDKHRSSICEDLGYHPSDLLQSNCIIWVEGPSDRLYLNFWINNQAPHLVEGIHYSIMFYGGKLAAHLSGEDPGENELEDFISLRRLNRRGVIVIDSDRAKKRARINKTKNRLVEEFDSGPGYSWITEGREIENYLLDNEVQEAIKSTKPSATSTSKFDRYSHFLEIKQKNRKKAQASKIDVAKFITDNFEPDFSPFDLGQQIRKLVEFVHESNPGVHVEDVIASRN